MKYLVEIEDEHAESIMKSLFASPYVKVESLSGEEDMDTRLSEQHRQILDQRLKEYEETPKEGSAWEEVRARIQSNL